MQTSLLSDLRSRKPEIRARWADLLHVEPVSTPLANPDALVHLINWSLQEIFRSLPQAEPSHHVPPEKAGFRSLCPCGRNPLLAYFIAGQQALREALILVQATTDSLDPLERDISLHELNRTFDEIARREIESFCGVCQYRTTKEEPPLLLAASAAVE
jgi:hypothetical protein